MDSSTENYLLWFALVEAVIALVCYMIARRYQHLYYVPLFSLLFLALALTLGWGLQYGITGGGFFKEIVVIMIFLRFWPGRKRIKPESSETALNNPQKAETNEVINEFSL